MLIESTALKIFYGSAMAQWTSRRSKVSSETIYLKRILFLNVIDSIYYSDNKRKRGKRDKRV